jgi:hypothetical protein
MRFLRLDGMEGGVMSRFFEWEGDELGCAVVAGMAPGVRGAVLDGFEVLRLSRRVTMGESREAAARAAAREVCAAAGSVDVEPVTLAWCAVERRRVLALVLPEELVERLRAMAGRWGVVVEGLLGLAVEMLKEGAVEAVPSSAAGGEEAGEALRFLLYPEAVEALEAAAGAVGCEPVALLREAVVEVLRAEIPEPERLKRARE